VEAVEQLHRLRVRRRRRARSKSIEDVERAAMLAKDELAAVRGRAQSSGTLGVQSKVPRPAWDSWKHPPARGAVALLTQLNVGAVDAPLILQRSRAQTRRGMPMAKPKARCREDGHRVADAVYAGGRHVPNPQEWQTRSRVGALRARRT